MSRIAASRTGAAFKSARVRYIPIVSTLAASLLAALPIVAGAPLVPDIAFLVLIAWRLLRPELWAAYVALPLGLFNDLVAGHPLGQSMAVWTIVFLAFDLVETRLVWRDYLMDWGFATLAIIFHTLAGWYVARMMGSAAHFSILLPQIGLAILAFPLVARIVLALDRWRLSR